MSGTSHFSRLRYHFERGLRELVRIAKLNLTFSGDFMRVTSIALLLFALPLWAQEANPVLVGRVTKVVDGDTIDVKLQSGTIRVRLFGVDAPEKNQFHGKDAAASLARLVLRKNVDIEPFEQDRYERLIGIVYIKGLNVNADLVKRGHAWAYRRYMRRADAGLCTLEAEARAANRGLWAASKSEVVAPWEWRKRKSEKASDFRRVSAADCVASIGKRS